MSMTAILARNPRSHTDSSSGMADRTRWPWPSPPARPAAARWWRRRLGGACRRRTSRPSGWRPRSGGPRSRPVGVGLALGAALVEVALAVAVGRQVAAVDGGRLAQLRELLVRGGGHAVHAGVQERLEPAQLGGEAVAGMHARDASRVGAAERGTQGGMLSDQSDGAGPRRQRVEALIVSRRAELR